MLVSALVNGTSASAKERLLTAEWMVHGPIASGADVVWGRSDRGGFGLYRDVPGGRDGRIGLLPRLDLPTPGNPFAAYPLDDVDLLARDGRIAVMRHGRFHDRYGGHLVSHKARLDTRGPDGGWRSLWSCDNSLLRR